VQLATGGAAGVSGVGNITYVEDPTVKLGSIWTTGNASITSRFGSIIDDPAATNSFNVNGSGSVLTLNAPGGSALIFTTAANHTAGTTGGNIIAASINSAGPASIFSSDTITLGASAANAITVVSGNNIAQSGPLNIFGSASFNATSAFGGPGGSISLLNTGNSFGPISLLQSTVNQPVSIVESGTLNLRTVTMAGSGNGTFSATSINGDIISTGFGGVKPGGISGFLGSGTVTLVAANGNISVGDATTDVFTTGGVVFNAKNVSLSVLGSSTLVLGSASTASSATGNLTVTTATGSIANAGNLVVTGNASFQSGIGNITLNQSGNQFGGLKFVGNQISVTESNNMSILTGSSALGTAQLASGGNIGIVNVGGVVSFGNTVSMVATGNIILPKLIQAAGTLTVNAAGLKDLSALSISGDLGSKTPVNLGTGAYNAPQP